MSKFLLSLGLAGGLMVGSASAALAVEESQDYRNRINELNEMLSSRDTDIYELDFHADSLDRILVTNRLGESSVFHYVIFRLRNKTSDATVKEQEFTSRYDELLAEIAKEYEEVELDGKTLRVRTRDENDLQSTILDRAELGQRDRVVHMTVAAYDENKTRIDVLDDIYTGTQEKFNFDDKGDREIEMGYDLVRKRIEEQVRRRLWLPSEIAMKELPPFDSSERDKEGVATGELWGVLIFRQLPLDGDRFRVEVRGISNKTRNVVPRHANNEIADFYNTRVLRRMYVLDFERPGDEFGRDQDAMKIKRQGWEWDNTFQRLARRSHGAHAAYFLNNVADDQNRPNEQVIEEFEAYREANPELFEGFE